MIPMDMATELVGRSGFNAWELFYLEKRIHLVKAANGKTSSRLSASEKGIGARASQHGRSASASTTDLTEQGLSAMLSRLSESVLAGSPDPWFALPSPRSDGPAKRPPHRRAMVPPGTNRPPQSACWKRNRRRSVRTRGFAACPTATSASVRASWRCATARASTCPLTFPEPPCSWSARPKKGAP